MLLWSHASLTRRVVAEFQKFTQGAPKIADRLVFGIAKFGLIIGSDVARSCHADEILLVFERLNLPDSGGARAYDMAGA